MISFFVIDDILWSIFDIEFENEVYCADRDFVYSSSW